MDPNFLEFEQPIAELQAKISELRYVTDDSDINISEEIHTLEKKAEHLTSNIFSKLTPWQISQLSRHPSRPYTLDYIDRMFTDFEFLHGDRAYSNDYPIIGGIGRLDGKPVMV
ncbi:MAG: acetyl-CoA carboxylase carboxyl transferase subunit alpha, partial [Chitinophagales bacterium]